MRIPVQSLEDAEPGDQGAALQSELQLPGVAVQVIAVPLVTQKDLEAQVFASL